MLWYQTDVGCDKIIVGEGEMEEKKKKKREIGKENINYSFIQKFPYDICRVSKIITKGKNALKVIKSHPNHVS